MTDIHNRIEQVENINKPISLSQEISLNNKLIIAELDYDIDLDTVAS